MKCPVLSSQYTVLSTVCILFVAQSAVKAGESYAGRLKALAAKCDELGLSEQAKITRQWSVARHPGRQYLFIPLATDPTAPKAGASETVRQWHRRFMELRREQAAALFAQARRASDAGDGARAYQLLFEILREDSEHADARRVVGYIKQGSQWRPVGWERATARAAAFNHPRLGWPARSFWTLETPHYSIVSNHSQRELVEAGEQLENLHALWRQIFFRYWSAPEALAARLAGRDVPLAGERPRMNVVLFKTRQEYAAQVAAAHPKAASTLGLYDDKQRIAYFFAGDVSVYPTWHHEATHQLFQEAVAGVVDEPGSERNFWALEGIALYMESLANHGTFWTVGGCEADRLQFARYRVMTGDLDLPLAKIAGLSRAGVQNSGDIGRIYTAAAGLAHFLMDGQQGTYRSAFLEHVSTLYRSEGSFDALIQASGRQPPELDLEYREYLNVTDDDLAGIPSPAACKNLSLCRTRVTDAGLAQFAGTRHLRWLDLSFTAASDAGLAHFAGNTGLKQLFLEGTQVTEASLPLIAAFRQLEELDLSRLPITDEGLVHLRGLKQLEQLHYNGTKVTDDGIRKLKASLPNLTLNPEP